LYSILYWCILQLRRRKKKDSNSQHQWW